MLKRSFSHFFTIFISLLLLFACGSSQKGYLIGIDPSWYPVELMGREKNVQGFSLELLGEIAKVQNINISTLAVSWDNILPKLQNKDVDAILSSMRPYTFLENVYDFSEPFLLTGPVLVMPFDSSINSIAGLNGKEIAVIRDSSAVEILEKNPEVLIRVYDTVPQALNDIVANVIDGAVINGLIAEGYTLDLYQKKLKVVTPPLDDEGLRLISLHNNASHLIKVFNAGLSELKKSGKYDKLTKKWSLK